MTGLRDSSFPVFFCNNQIKKSEPANRRVPITRKLGVEVFQTWLELLPIVPCCNKTLKHNFQLSYNASAKLDRSVSLGSLIFSNDLIYCVTSAVSRNGLAHFCSAYSVDV